VGSGALLAGGLLLLVRRPRRRLPGLVRQDASDPEPRDLPGGLQGARARCPRLHEGRGGRTNPRDHHSKDELEAAGLPGILVDIDDETCYDLGKEREALAGTFESQTTLKIGLLSRLIDGVNGRKMTDFDAIVIGGGPAGAAAAATCARSGLKVLMVERGGLDRHKPCGGVLPPVLADVIEDIFEREIPPGVMCSPRTLGLFYVPPSGRENGGVVRNYRLLNVDRDRFDRWLREVAVEEGAKLWCETSFLGFEQSESLRVLLARKDGSIVRATARYLVGADGVYSRVRAQLYGAEERVLHVLQERWEAEGDFEDCFYAFFRGAVSPTYGYLIPKDGLLVIGVGCPRSDASLITHYIRRFRGWLAEEFAFRGEVLHRREGWAIPYGFIREGVGGAILVGDAAGLCNPLSGEGIRFAIESGEAAGAAIREAADNGDTLAAIYSEHIAHLARTVRKVHRFATSLTDEGRERVREIRTRTNKPILRKPEPNEV